MVNLYAAYQRRDQARYYAFSPKKHNTQCVHLCKKGIYYRSIVSKDLGRHKRNIGVII